MSIIVNGSKYLQMVKALDAQLTLAFAGRILGDCKSQS